MKTLSRRQFLKTSMAAGLGLALTRPRVRAASSSPIGANDTIRLAVIGMGDTEAVGGVGGRGHQLIEALHQVSGVKIVALCDVDPAMLRREATALKAKGQDVATHGDLRRVFDDRNIDGVVIATPNHWHGLATVWACQAGKDVYVEKPFSYNMWEGRQMAAAARKYGRMVQTGTQNRSSPLLRNAFEEVRRGALGRMRLAHAIIYRARDGISRTEAPLALPADVDFDLWCGPARKEPLRRTQLHYEWHWFWETGNGEIGNNGVHMMDVCRWALGSNQPPPRALSIGGRFAVNDSAETANTQIALLDYQPVPLICEVRNVRQGAAGVGTYRGRARCVVLHCEGGFFVGDSASGTLFDRQGKKIKDIANEGPAVRLDAVHLANFAAAMRSRTTADLACEAWEGHCSAAACHMANISYRLGRQARPEAIRERITGQHDFAEAFDRLSGHLRENGVNIGATPATLGPWVNYDPKQESFTGEFADAANALNRREYRAPFVVPTIA
jgi:predicted dehydrogenase